MSFLGGCQLFTCLIIQADILSIFKTYTKIYSNGVIWGLL